MDTSNIVQLNPESEVRFVKKDIASLPETFIELKNVAGKIVFYKIKTTDPKKYVVKPNQGVLTQGKGTKILITTQKPSMQTIKKDRFLVVACTYEGATIDIPEDPQELESFLKKTFDGTPSEKQFMKKLKICNDETLGLSSASFKGNRNSLLKPSEEQEDSKRSSIHVKTTNVDDHQEEKYNELVAQVNELAKKKVELVNNIRLKHNNRDLMRKARYAAVGNEGAGGKTSNEQGISFGVLHIGIAFAISLLIGLYFGSG